MCTLKWHRRDAFAYNLSHTGHLYCGIGLCFDDWLLLEYRKSGSECKASWKRCSDLELVPKGHFEQENSNFVEVSLKTQAFVLTCTVKSCGTVKVFPQFGQLKLI